MKAPNYLSKATCKVADSMHSPAGPTSNLSVDGAFQVALLCLATEAANAPPSRLVKATSCADVN